VQLQCTEHYDSWLPECLEVMSAPFDDGIPIPEALFHAAQGWLDAHWDSGCKILVSCAAGRSRSVTMAIALLSRKGGLSFLDAANDVISRVPDAYPHPYVLASASFFSGEPLQLEQLQSIYAAVPNQPAYPWSLELLQEAAFSAASRS
jgi:protein-tyrosine phosphatase